MAAKLIWVSGGSSGVELLPSKQVAAGSNPVPRSTRLASFASHVGASLVGALPFWIQHHRQAGAHKGRPYADPSLLQRQKNFRMPLRLIRLCLRIGDVALDWTTNRRATELLDEGPD